jgi:hypothetical protein
MKKRQHSPDLDTVILVEKAIKGAKGSVVTIAQTKKLLPKKVSQNMLKAILIYLEESNKIAVSVKGITWIYNPSPKMRRAIVVGISRLKELFPISTKEVKAMKKEFALWESAALSDMKY